MSPRVLRAYHRTETLHPKGFVARVEIVGIIRHLRDDTWVYDTKDEARKREAELAEKWKHDHDQADAVVEFCN